MSIRCNLQSKQSDLKEKWGDPSYTTSHIFRVTEDTYISGKISD